MKITFSILALLVSLGINSGNLKRPVPTIQEVAKQKEQSAQRLLWQVKVDIAELKFKKKIK